jgi:FkbM family methyltransferase
LIFYFGVFLGNGKQDMPNVILRLAAAAAQRLPMPVKRSLYRITPLARMIRSGLNLAVPQGLTTIEVAGGALAGRSLSLNLQEEKDYWLGTYEPDLQQAITELVKPGMVAYDVGANIGYITLLLAQAVGETGQVISFEPLPDNVERLLANLTLNNLEQRVQVEAAAVVDRSRKVEFLVGPSGGMGKARGSTGRQNVQYSKTLEVPGLSLDEFVYQLGRPEPQIIKMDIEGGEVLALPGMARLLKEAKPLILMELHGVEAAQFCWEALVQAGYQIGRMAPGFPAVSAWESLNWKSYLVAFPLA